MNKIIIYHNKTIRGNYWNWRYVDNHPVPVFGKVFNTKKETIEDAKRYVKEMGIKKYKIKEE